MKQKKHHLFILLSKNRNEKEHSLIIVRENNAVKVLLNTSRCSQRAFKILQYLFIKY